MNKMIDATLDIGYFDVRPVRSEVPARVLLDASGVTLVVPDDKGEVVLWHGERRGQGHYVLTSALPGMDASLHRFADSAILEGFWRSGRKRGFWRLHLPVDAVIPQENRVVTLPDRARKRRAAGGGSRRRVRRAA